MVKVVVYMGMVYHGRASTRVSYRCDMCTVGSKQKCPCGPNVDAANYIWVLGFVYGFKPLKTSVQSMNLTQLAPYILEERACGVHLDKV